MGVSASRDERSRGVRSAGRPERHADAVVWHDLECGSYTADLALWRELARDAHGRVLDVGAGTGRVTLELARAGHPLTALDLDAELLAALRERAGGLDVETVCADALTFELERRDFALCLVPMQTVQLLGGAAGRSRLMRRARAHLAPGGVLACAIVTDVECFDCDAGEPGPAAEIARVAGSSYVSRPTRVLADSRVVRIERDRGVVAGTRAATPEPSAWERDVIELDRVSVAQLQREGREAGLTLGEPQPIAATDEHTASVAVIFRA